MECYSAIKWNTFESVLMMWMNLQPVLQSELSQEEKDKYLSIYILMYIYMESRKMIPMYLQGNNGETDIEN